MQLPATLPKPPKPPEWMTWCPNRTTKGEFAPHNILGQAKSAFRNQILESRYGGESRYVTIRNKRDYEAKLCHGALYRLVNGEWRLWCFVETGTWPSEHPLWDGTKIDEIPAKWRVTHVIEEDPLP